MAYELLFPPFETPEKYRNKFPDLSKDAWYNSGLVDTITCVDLRNNKMYSRRQVLIRGDGLILNGLQQIYLR